MAPRGWYRLLFTKWCKGPDYSTALLQLKPLHVHTTFSCFLLIPHIFSYFLSPPDEIEWPLEDDADYCIPDDAKDLITCLLQQNSNDTPFSHVFSPLLTFSLTIFSYFLWFSHIFSPQTRLSGPQRTMQITAYQTMLRALSLACYNRTPMTPFYHVFSHFLLFSLTQTRFSGLCRGWCRLLHPRRC